MIVDTQRPRILNHLATVGPLTSLDAMALHGVARLAARIEELRKEGHDIETTMVEVKDRHSSARRVARYVLLSPPAAAVLFDVPPVQDRRPKGKATR